MNEKVLIAAQTLLDAVAEHSLAQLGRVDADKCSVCDAGREESRHLGVRHVYALSFRGGKTRLCSHCIGSFNAVATKRGNPLSLCVTHGMQRYARPVNKSLDEVDQLLLAQWLSKKLLKQSANQMQAT